MSSTAIRGRGGASASTRPRAGQRRRHFWEGVSGWGFLLPNLLFLATFLFAPIIYAFVVSFQDFQGFGEAAWVWLANYERMVADPVFWRSLGNTLLFTLVTVPIEMIGGLGLAVLMNSVLPARAAFRTILVLPMVVSGAATAMIGGLMFYETNGIVNKVLVALGMDPIAWQSGSAAAFVAVSLVAIWMRLGFNMIIYLAGLQGISMELYEAARIDGASKWQQFRTITVPLVGPSTFFLLIMNVIATFQIFDLIYVMTGGGPANATQVLGTYAYHTAFGPTRAQGYGAALGMVILVISLLFTYIQWRSSKTRDEVG